MSKRIHPQTMIEVHVDEQSTYTPTDAGCPFTCTTNVNTGTKAILERLDAVEGKLNAIITKQSDIDTKFDDLISQQSQHNMSLSFLLGGGGDSTHAHVPVLTAPVAVSTTCTSVATPDNVAAVATSIVVTDTT